MGCTGCAGNAAASLLIFEGIMTEENKNASLEALVTDIVKLCNMAGSVRSSIELRSSDDFDKQIADFSSLQQDVLSRIRDLYAANAVPLDINRIKASLDSGVVAVPPGLSPEEKIEFIESNAAQPSKTVPEGTYFSREELGPIDANRLERMAKERPDECFLKGSGVLKLIGAIRQLERELRKAAPAQPVA